MFDDIMKIAAAGMAAQGTRVRTVAENIANANSTAQTPGTDPYRRKVVSFADTLDRASGENLVKVKGVFEDQTPFQQKFEPGHPAADANGYVSYPNVNTIIEMNDMREGERSYQANVDIVDAAKTMVSKTIDLLKS